MQGGYIKNIQIIVNDTQHRIPFISCRIPAGFPSPAEDYLEGTLDLNEHLIQHPEATYFLRVTGNSMIHAGIFSGDTLIVDRSLKPMDKCVVIAIVNGEFTVKRLRIRDGRIELVAENPLYPPIVIHDNSELVIWGTVTYVIHKPK